MTSSFERRLGASPAERDPASRNRRSDAAEGGTAPNAYARFIPREEVRSFSAWAPSSFGGAGTAESPSGTNPAPLTPELVGAQLQAARQGGYQDGYRDGLVALEGFKQSYAQQVTAPIGALTAAYREQLQQLEQALATQVAEVAIALARQVVRAELATRPELVAAVAQEALAATLVSAQQIAVHLHPDDQTFVAQHAAEALASRGARLVADAAVARGGCVVETEVGVIDAGIDARWRRAAAAMGRPSEYDTDRSDDSESAGS